MRLSKKNKELFYRCQGACQICLNDGDCKLQKIIKDKGMARIKGASYGE